MDIVSPELQKGECLVLKNRQFVGPFSREELEEAWASGQISGEWLVQLPGTPLWRPVRAVLQKVPEPLPAELPDWISLLKWGWQRLIKELEQPNPQVAWIALALGSIALLCASLPMLFWLPWFAFASIIAVGLIRLGRLFPALLLMLGIFGLPALLLRTAHGGEPSRGLALLGRLTGADGAAATEPGKVAAAPEDIPLESTPITGLSIEPESPKSVTILAGGAGTDRVPSAQVAGQDADATEPPKSQPSSPSAPARSAASEGGELMRKHMRTLVIVRDGDASGSGFIANLGGKPYLFTNNHVAAAMKRPRFTLLDGTVLTPVSVDSAVGHDLIRFGLKDVPGDALEVERDMNTQVAIGDGVFVFGNSDGGGVVTNLPGEVAGLGPDRIEVTAEFIPGNSGSPIIHSKTGKAIGIATYLTKRYDEFSTTAGRTAANGKSEVVRRFGYRLDSVQTWQPVNWPQFVAEAGRIQGISSLTEDIFNFLDALRKNNSANFATETLRRPATEWLGKINRSQTSEVDRLNATQSFLSSLRFLVRRDITEADGVIRYDYFRQELNKEREVRDRLYKVFDERSRNVGRRM